MKRAVVHGSVVASYVVEDFSLNRLRTLTHAEIHERYEDFKHFSHFERFTDDRRPQSPVWTELKARG